MSPLAWPNFHYHCLRWGPVNASKNVIHYISTPFSHYIFPHGNLAITFDHDLQMTRDLDHSKALVEAHLFRGVSSQSEHFPKIAFLARSGQTGPPLPPHSKM